MLVLTRKVGETVRIGENIEVMVIEVAHGNVRLGFQCPKEIPILRQEVHDREKLSGIKKSSSCSRIIDSLPIAMPERA